MEQSNRDAKKEDEEEDEDDDVAFDKKQEVDEDEKDDFVQDMDKDPDYVPVKSKSKSKKGVSKKYPGADTSSDVPDTDSGRENSFKLKLGGGGGGAMVFHFESEIFFWFHSMQKNCFATIIWANGAAFAPQSR